ncbi:MAG: glycosyltransferase family 4 protein [Acidimicrobiales bacterium]
MVAVHQFLPTFAPRDAIGTHTRHAQRILRDMGVESDIYAEGLPAGGWKRARPYRTFSWRRTPLGRTWLLYQFSTGSAVAEYLRTRPEPKVVNYHNVTTAALFAPWEPHVGVELDEGRRQLGEMAPACALGIAVSSFNEADLRAAGARHTVVAPVLVDLDDRSGPPDPEVGDRLARAKARGGADWLFVGRVAPHKCQHDVVRAFAAYRRLYDPAARLHLVGAVGSHAYATALQRFVCGLGLTGAVDLAGSVSPPALAAYYEAADAFVCLSEHEGFCVPVIEAMGSGTPVVAFGAAAVPETVRGAGVILAAKDPVVVAAAVSRVLGDAGLRVALAAAGRRRAADFSLARSSARFRAVMADLLSGVSGAP